MKSESCVLHSSLQYPSSQPCWHISLFEAGCTLNTCTFVACVGMSVFFITWRLVEIFICDMQVMKLSTAKAAK